MTIASRPSLEALLERDRAIDPDLVLVADEVDAELLAWFSTLTPAERLDHSAKMARELEELRDARSSR